MRLRGEPDEWTRWVSKQQADWDEMGASGGNSPEFYANPLDQDRE